MAEQEKFKELMANLIRAEADRLTNRVAKLEMKFSEVLAVLTLVENYLNDPDNHSATDEFTELLRNAHMRLSVSLNIQK